jgi:hypothetical protein
MSSLEERWFSRRRASLCDTIGDNKCEYNVFHIRSGPCDKIEEKAQSRRDQLATLNPQGNES